MYFIYTFLLTVAILLVSPYYLFRSRRYLPSLPDRLGYLKLPPLKRTIWVHAVSVGEVKAVEKLIERLRVQFPGQPIAVSTTTLTGQKLARERSDIIDYTFYFPLDLPFSIRRVLNRLDPAMVIIAETEIWPNFLRACRRRSVPVAMVNGRISDKSFARYRLIRTWLQRVLADYTVIGMQSETDRQRIEAIGGDPGKIMVLGNLKYDVAGSSRQLDAAFRGYLASRHPVWITASTMPGEEELIMEAYRKLRTEFATLQLVIAPRHPERFNLVEQIIKASGAECVRRTRLGEAQESGIFLLDTIGELAAAFEYADVVFMGGTLVPKGGHNVLEPARHSKPIIFGPHMENFRDISRLFLEHKAAVQIQDVESLIDGVRRLLKDAKLADELGRNAKAIIDENAGATDRVLRLLRPTEAGR